MTPATPPTAPPQFGNAPVLVVTREEQGMKLLRFLERRLSVAGAKSVFYKWIRTGQVRINGNRAKPHDLLTQEDTVRIPPFAFAFTGGGCSRIAPGMGDERNPPSPKTSGGSFPPLLGADLPVLSSTDDIMVLVKPGGLPVQPGSRHADSVTGRLASAFAYEAFVPAPAHRLDRHTSGLLLVGLSHETQRNLHAWFRGRDIIKEYLTWVIGCWPHPGPCLLHDALTMVRDRAGMERMAARSGGVIPLGAVRDKDSNAGMKRGTACNVPPEQALSAMMPIRRVERRDLPSSLRHAGDGATLLLVRLLTGKKHQIRIQTTSRECPVIGDGRYGGPSFSAMLLHAFALRLPNNENGPAEYVALPDWPAPFFPEATELATARRELEQAMEVLSIQQSTNACP